MNSTKPIPNYQHLDLSGDAQLAAERMEARAREAASEELFQQLVAPLLTADVRTILEFGCGTGALSRRIARAAPQAAVHASDKSEGMLVAARRLAEAEGIPNLQLQPWDVLDENAFPFPPARYDLILSSVVIPYLDDAQVRGLIARLASRLNPSGVLAFIEQDLSSDTVYFPRAEFFREVLTRKPRQALRPSPFILRPMIREAGLQVLPRRSYLWADDGYGDYTRDLLERFADAASQDGRISLEERDEWKKTLDDLARSGDFYYGIVYHLIAGRRV